MQEKDISEKTFSTVGDLFRELGWQPAEGIASLTDAPSAGGLGLPDDEKALNDAWEMLNKAWADGGRLIKASERIIGMVEWAETKTRRLDQLASEMITSIASIERVYSEMGFVCKYRRDSAGCGTQIKTSWAFLATRFFVLLSCVSLLTYVNLSRRTENDGADGQAVPEPDGAVHGRLVRDLKTGDNNNSNNNCNNYFAISHG